MYSVALMRIRGLLSMCVNNTQNTFVQKHCYPTLLYCDNLIKDYGRLKRMLVKFT